MKRTIQGLLVTSIFLIGCAGIPADNVAPKTELSSTVSARELSDTRQNLTGICIAMMKYGLPRDDETRDHVQAKIEWLGETAEKLPDLESKEGLTARETLEIVESGYWRCDPQMARDIDIELEELGQT